MEAGTEVQRLESDNNATPSEFKLDIVDMDTEKHNNNSNKLNR